MSGDRHLDDRLSRVRLLVADRVRVRQRPVSGTFGAASSAGAGVSPVTRRRRCRYDQFRRRSYLSRPTALTRCTHAHTLSLPYAERLLRLGLWTLEDRRNRCDLIEVFKMFYGYTEIHKGFIHA